MYVAVMLRKCRSLRRGFFIKEFDTLEELARYTMLPFNCERVYRIIGLTLKEKQILNTKCWSIYDNRKSLKTKR